MGTLPIDKKALIQASYVRYREILIALPAARYQVQVSFFAFWTGLSLFLFAFYRVAIDRELPEIFH